MLFPDDALFDYALTNLAKEIAAKPVPPINALPCDRWVARSALQKAIRRAEPELAQRALANLFNYDRRATWRALTIIAIEDVGVANIELLAQIVAAQRDRKWRERMGGDWRVMATLVRLIATSEHCQAACDLLLRAINDPALEHARQAALDGDRHALAEPLWSASADVLDRGIAALALGGGLAEGQPLHDPCAVFDILAEASRSTHVVATCRAAWQISRNEMALLLPLVWERWSAASAHTVSNDTFPPVQLIDGVPGYALDQFTRIGNTISRALLKTDAGLRRISSDAGIPTAQQPRAVGDLLFLIEGGLLANRATWAIGDSLRLPHRQLPAVAKLGEHLPKATTQLGSEHRYIAQLRQQNFHPVRP